MKRALDLFCCAGGATRGLQLAGYHVTGVDIRPQKHYIGDHFIQADALDIDLDGYDLIWASPPCQAFSVLTPTAHKAKHANLIAPIRDRLDAQSAPWIMENVAGARGMLRAPIMLCGSMFGLNIQRHRYFEIGNCDPFFLLPPCNHSDPPVLVSGTSRRIVNGKRYEYTKAEKEAAIGIDWMLTSGLDEAIPPAYSQFLAEQIEAYLEPIRQLVDRAPLIVEVQS